MLYGLSQSRTYVRGSQLVKEKGRQAYAVPKEGDSALPN
jgi:hypothetical protein